MNTRRSPAAQSRRAPGGELHDHSAHGKTRGLTEGAILASLTALVAAAGLVIPFIGILLAPLPLMLLVMRWGIRTAVLAAIVAGLILLQFFGPMVALSVTVVFAPLGLALGWGVRRGLGAQTTVLAGAAAFLLSSLATLALTAFVLHQDVLGELIRTQVQAWESAQSMAQRMGAPQSQIDDMHRAVVALPQFLHTTFPVLVALGALLWSYFCYLLARSVLRRIGHHIPAVPPMLAWRIPPALASGLLWASGGIALASIWVPRLGGAGLNAVLVNLFVFAFQGVLVGITWANARQIPRVAQIMAGTLLLVSGFLPLLALAIAGMLDTWYDFRHLTKPPAAPVPPHGALDGAPAEPPETPAPSSGRPRVKVVHRS